MVPNPANARESPGSGPKGSRSPSRIWAWKFAGIVLVIPTFIAFSIAVSGKEPWRRILAAACAGVLGGGSTSAYIRGKRLAARKGEDILKNDPRPPVLYLRAFKDDEITSQSGTDLGAARISFTTEEERLAKGFQDIGPMVAIGIPTEELPLTGAARIYVDDSEWRDRALELMEQARLVVLRIGPTEGLQWEFAMANWQLPSAKLILLVPAGKAAYEAFSEHANLRLRKPLPEYPGRVKRLPDATIIALVRFAADWTPHLILLAKPGWRAGKPLAKALKSALEPVCHDLGIAPQSASPNT